MSHCSETCATILLTSVTEFLERQVAVMWLVSCLTRFIFFIYFRINIKPKQSQERYQSWLKVYLWSLIWLLLLGPPQRDRRQQQCCIQVNTVHNEYVLYGKQVHFKYKKITLVIFKMSAIKCYCTSALCLSYRAYSAFKLYFKSIGLNK